LNPADVVGELRYLERQVADIQQLLSHIQQLFDVWGILARTIQANLDAVDGLLYGYLLGTYDVAAPGRPQPFVDVGVIRSVEPALALAADAALVAVAMWSFYRLMWTHAVRNRYAVQLMLPRLLLAVLLVNFAKPLFQTAVDVNNGLCDAIRPISGPWNLKGLFDLAGSAFGFGSGANAPVATEVVLAALFLGYVVLAFAYVVRYSLLVVLAITAPLAALMFVLPETHRYARQWGSLFVATLFMQPLQLLVLAVGYQLDTDGVFPVRHLFALATIYIALKVPGALHSTSSAGSRAESAARRYAVKAAKALAKA
jgi:hypothetical protein